MTLSRQNASQHTSTISTNISTRIATPKDLEILYSFITQKAEFDHFPVPLPFTQKQLQQMLFDSSPLAQVLLAEVQQIAVGFLLFFETYSSFLAQPSLWIDDLFVRSPMRYQGVGTALLNHLQHIAQARQCGRIEWIVNAHNTPALNFYQKHGAQILDNIQVCRLILPKLQDK